MIRFFTASFFLLAGSAALALGAFVYLDHRAEIEAAQIHPPVTWERVTPAEARLRAESAGLIDTGANPWGLER